jgi:hypothetical protein
MCLLVLLQQQGKGLRREVKAGRSMLMLQQQLLAWQVLLQLVRLGLTAALLVLAQQQGLAVLLCRVAVGMVRLWWLLMLWAAGKACRIRTLLLFMTQQM